jgi:heme/copper-type cytochrome/quinol oxidase subunit 3
MWLFLTSLSMLFAAAMISYIVIRLLGAHSPRRGSLHLPKILWLSTFLVIGVSFAMSRALHFLRHERQQSFLTAIWVALVLALGFLGVQTPAMLILLREHHALRSIGLFLYGLVFVLILLHALHVLGGMVALAVVALKARRGVYDHEHYQPVRHTAMYWHFLDLIWILMFAAFLATA